MTGQILHVFDCDIDRAYVTPVVVVIY
jgi:hypothetical protein